MIGYPDVEKDESYVRFLIKVIFCHSFYTFYTIESTHCFEYCWPLQLWPWLWAMNIQDQCADCGKEFSSRLCFNKHYREYHQKNESNWQCQQRLWKSNRGQGLLWCDPGLRGWSTGGSSQGHLGCLKSILLRQNKHSHPLIYMRGMKSDDLFAIVDNWAISKMVFGKNLSGSNPLENMTYPLFSSPTFYMSGAVWFLYVVGLLQIKQNEEKVELRKFHLSSSCKKKVVILFKSSVFTTNRSSWNICPQLHLPSTSCDVEGKYFCDSNYIKLNCHSNICPQRRATLRAGDVEGKYFSCTEYLPSKSPALKVVCPQSRLPSKSSALNVACPQRRGLNVAGSTSPALNVP